MKQAALAFVLMCAASSTATATGGFFCEADDASLLLSASGSTGRGMGGPIISVDANAELRVTGTPAALTKLDLSKSLVHHWLDHPDLRLHFYAETTGSDPFASMELVVKTIAVEADEIAYEGDYQLKIFQAEPPAGVVTEDGVISATGKVRCGGE